MVNIDYPAKRPAYDQTGLKLAGRRVDGRYVYCSISGMDHYNTVALTHAQRVGLALCRAVVAGITPATPRRTFNIYPMTRESGAWGYATQGGTRMWLQRPMLGELGQALMDSAPAPRTYSSKCLDTLAHELAHNQQPTTTKSHGPEWDSLYTKNRVAIDALMHKGWPKLDMRKLRDSKPK